MTWIKICGLTSAEDVNAAVEAGADAIGLNFYGRSPRYISAELAQEMIKIVPPRVKKVGVFVNAFIDEVNTMQNMLGLDYVQFHGDESPEYCEQFGEKCIKAFRVKGEARELQRNTDLYRNAGMFLFDQYKDGLYGGTGSKFNLDLITPVEKFRKNVIVSGGLSVENIQDVLIKIHPYGVDVCSKLESSPGKKDHEKVKAFVHKVRKLDDRDINVCK
ncbi:MAG: phosphoribosylanthranilate isomerase [Chlamydiota bacterium]|nr:phosphoribosylanthranilate isomerase [Chlamydiota bacterium]